MIDHFNLPVADLECSSQFYSAVLKSLDMKLLMHDKDAVGFGKEFWEFGIVLEPNNTTKIHLAFVASRREQVRRFHSNALKAGGLDNGSPGLRPEYSPSYYSAYIIDPDGHNIEAVCRY